MGWDKEIMKKIHLSINGKHKGKYFAIVDDRDFEWLNQYKWVYSESSSYKHNKWHRYQGYAKRTYDLMRMHRLIINAPKGMEVDHINRDTLDNRRSNLRLATRLQNRLNSKK
jgi:hypothetical protein